jgi:hypothetical protein
MEVLRSEPIMNGLSRVVAAAALVIAMTSLAHAETWCMRDSGSPGFSVCAFSSGRDCVRAALYGPGNLCVREEAVVQNSPRPTGKPAKKHRTGRHRPHADP